MRTSCRIAVLSIEPSGLSLFHAYDPDSSVVLSLTHDALIRIGSDGRLEPALAVRWEQTSPVEWEIELRQGVRFHNGEPFDVESVIATFHAHFTPAPSPAAHIWGTILRIDKRSSHVVRIVTRAPDAMFERRMTFFAISPAAHIALSGRDSLRDEPIGTGEYRFVRWVRGKEVVLARNRDHWEGRATIDELVLPILRQKRWALALTQGDVDVVANLDVHDAVRLSRVAGVHVESRESALQSVFLLRNRGPLADVRVRRGLNHAVHRQLIASVAHHAMATPAKGIADPRALGHTTDLAAYPYNPDLARRILAEAGYGSGFLLRGLVAESSATIFFAVREFLSRVGVGLEAEIVPRPEWLDRTRHKGATGDPTFDGDFALIGLGNPMLDSLFRHSSYLFSGGPSALLNDPDYDARFRVAASAVGAAAGLTARRELERYASEQALALFMMHHHVHYASRDGFRMPLPSSAHFGGSCLADLRATQARPERAVARTPREPTEPPLAPSPDVANLLFATAHLDTFRLPPGAAFDDPAFRAIWANLTASEARWNVAIEPMMRELVAHADAKAHLANVMQATSRVAICGYGVDGRLLFTNDGYARMVDPTGTMDVILLLAEDRRNPGWDAITLAVEREGAWSGAVRVPNAGRPTDAPAQLHLTVTFARDEYDAVAGHVLVFSDFSGEEERIRGRAVRTILDNVPYALVRIDRSLRVLLGWSRSCDQFFTSRGDDILGVPLGKLLGVDERTSTELTMAVEQVFEGYLPDAAALAQLPTRLRVGGRWLSLSASCVHDARGVTESLLLTVADITALVLAETESERMRGVLTVLTHKTSFIDFIVAHADALAELAAREPDGPGEGWEAWQLLVRRELHTAKGCFGQFALHEIAARVHELEGRVRVVACDLRELLAAVQLLLRDNQPAWGISLEPRDRPEGAQEARLELLGAAVARATTLEDARAAVQSFLEDATSRSVAELLGPLGLAIEQQAAQRNKRVKLTLEGGDVRVPGPQAPVIRSLAHLARNAVDHGIEPPGERGDKGEVGQIRIHVERVPERLFVTVADDGRGIDEDRVVARAIELGVVDAASARSMARDARLCLVLADGMSTAEEVTDTSGRGVGASAVAATVAAAGGQLRISSVAWLGTTISIEVPLRSGATPRLVGASTRASSPALRTGASRAPLRG